LGNAPFPGDRDEARRGEIVCLRPLPESVAGLGLEWRSPGFLFTQYYPQISVDLPSRHKTTGKEGWTSSHFASWLCQARKGGAWHNQKHRYVTVWICDACRSWRLHSGPIPNPNDTAELVAGKEGQQRWMKVYSCSHARYYMDKVANNYIDLGILWLEKRPLGRKIW